MTAFSFGGFIGPTLGGALFETVGFPLASLFFIGIEAMLLLLIVFYSVTSGCQDEVQDCY